MANPADPGTFENWIADIAPIRQTQPKSGDTGTMEYWIADIIPLRFYTKQPSVAAAGGGIFQSAIMHSAILGRTMVR